MKYTVREFLTYTFGAIILFLLLTHAGGFAQGIKALSSGYTGGVKALQGH